MPWKEGETERDKEAAFHELSCFAHHMALTPLCPIHGVQLLGSPRGGAAWHLPKQLPTTWDTARPLLPFHAPPTAMWANTLPLPRQGTPDLHNLIKFCILGFEGAGL